MPSEKDYILEFKQYMKLDKMPYVIYADIESLTRKESSTTKISEYIPCGYPMSTIWGFDHIEDKHTLYRGKDCMKKFCFSLREESENAIDFEKRKMFSLTKGELKSHLDGKVYYIRQKKILKKFADNKNYRNVRKHCHLQVNIEVQHIAFVI